MLTYREAVALLRESRVDDPNFDAAELFCKFAEVSKGSLFADPDKSYEIPELVEAVGQRCKRVPLQYILGEWEFFGLPFKVSEACLCPRADTEITVEEALKLLPAGARILELCTGSGCIPISICHKRRDVRALATDIFDDTLAIAAQNAAANGVSDRVEFIKSSVFDRDVKAPDGGFDAIISNPPYIPTGDLDSLSPEVHCEPTAALDGGEDGLIFYREILGYYKELLSPRGFIALEIGFDQAEDIARLSRSNGLDCRIIKDLGGNDRCAICRPLK